MPPTSRKYRSAVMIIQLLLEELTRVEDGMVKSELYKAVGLKTAVGEKYLDQLIKAEYLTLTEEKWGKERVRHVIRISTKGLARFQWFIRLSNELQL